MSRYCLPIRAAAQCLVRFMQENKSAFLSVNQRLAGFLSSAQSHSHTAEAA
jgi:hypothetical protein